MARHKRKRGLARRHGRRGRSAIPMRIHGQVFLEPDTVAEAVQEIREEIAVGDLGVDLVPPPEAMRSEDLVLAGYGHARRRRR